MERVAISRAYLGLCFMQVCVCKDATDEEILYAANNKNPAGTHGGWFEVIREQEEYVQLHPVQCDNDPERLHIVLMC